MRRFLQVPWLVAAFVLVLVVAGGAMSVRQHLDQRKRTQALVQEVAQREANIAEHEAAIKRWEDPAYVKSQARQRLQFEMPGDTQYVVMDTDPNGSAKDLVLPDSFTAANAAKKPTPKGAPATAAPTTKSSAGPAAKPTSSPTARTTPEPKPSAKPTATTKPTSAKPTSKPTTKAP